MSHSVAVNPAESAPQQGLSIWGIASVLFMCALAYHYIVWGYNYRYSPAEDNWFNAGLMAIVLIPLAFLERPATIMLVNAIRLKDNFLVLVFWFVIVCGLGFMAFNITMSSHETISEQGENRYSNHTSNLETINRIEQTAKSMLKAAKLNARDMTPERAAGYLAAAEVQYNRSMTKASKMRSQQYKNAPIKQEHEGEFDWITPAIQSAFIGLMFSLGAIIVTIYEQMHIKTTQRIPAFSLAPKLGQEWQAFKENFTAGNFDVDPTRGFFNGMFFKVKKQVTAPAEPSRPAATETQHNGTSSNVERPKATEKARATSNNNSEPARKEQPKTFKEQDERIEKNAAKTGKVYTQCPNCEALYNPKLSAIMPTDKNKKGKIRCQECAESFVGLDHVIDNEDAKKIVKNDTDSGILSYDGYTLAALKDEGFEYHFNMGTYYFVLPNKEDGTATCLLPHPDKNSWLYTAKMDNEDRKQLIHHSSETGGPFQDFHWAIAEHRQIENKTKEKGPGGPYFDYESFYDIQSRGHTTTVDDVPVLSSNSFALIPHPTKPAWIFREEFKTKHPLKWMDENPSTPLAIKFKNTLAQYKQLANGTTPAKPAANSQDNVIRGKFAANSQQIRLDNQEVTDSANSPRIHRELAANSPRIVGGANSQDSQAENSPNSRQVDLSGIIEINGNQEKLKALSETIDRLAADPDYDGVLFSPTKAFKELHLNYKPVQEIFNQKRVEGKISQTTPYKITFKAPE